MGIEWSNELNTGIEEIDKQHRELFARFNSLLEAYSAGKGKDEIIGFHDFLTSYVQEHFKSEEEMMLRHSYPGYDEQLIEHESFRTQLSEIRQNLMATKIENNDLISIGDCVADWLIDHIHKKDRLFGEFLRQKQ